MLPVRAFPRAVTGSKNDNDRKHRLAAGLWREWGSSLFLTVTLLGVGRSVVPAMTIELPGAEYRALFTAIEEQLRSSARDPGLSGDTLIKSLDRRERRFIDPDLISAYRRLSRNAGS